MNMSWSRHSKFPHPANKDSSPNLLFFHYQVLFNALQGIKLEHTTQQITKFANKKHSCWVVLVWFWFDVILLAVCTGNSGWVTILIWLLWFRLLEELFRWIDMHFVHLTVPNLEWTTITTALCHSDGIILTLHAVTFTSQSLLHLLVWMKILWFAKVDSSIRHRCSHLTTITLLQLD